MSGKSQATCATHQHNYPFDMLAIMPCGEMQVVAVTLGSSSSGKSMEDENNSIDSPGAAPSFNSSCSLEPLSRSAETLSSARVLAN